MADINYVRKYFTENAAGWLAGAYGEGASQYPVGAQRVRLAIEAVVERVGSTRCRLVDLGCGGGELCIHAARLGMNVTGVDIADGMISQATKKLETLPKEVRKRLAFTRGGVLDGLLPASRYDAVTALGLIEYLPEDAPFFKEAFRLLKPGGVLVVSCRNRLFNMASLNEYTSREVECGSALALLSEIASLTAGKVPPESMDEFVHKLESAIPRLEEALHQDAANHGGSYATSKGTPDFAQPRRQHTPLELGQSARTAGFTGPAFLGVHPHPLPPRLEADTPRFYNQLASVFEAFEKSPVSLVWSSAFIGVFTKPK